MMKYIIYLTLLYTVGSLDIKNNIDTDFIYQTTKQKPANGFEFEMMDLLGLTDRASRMKRHPSLRNSASKFLLKVYNEINEEDQVPISENNHRYKRDLYNDNFITKLDRLEIEKCNNIITFCSKPSPEEQQMLNQSTTPITKRMRIFFNTNDVPSDLQLVHSVLRLYQNPALGKYHDQPNRNTTISIYHRLYNRQLHTHEYRILISINATTAYKGWLEFNTTRLLTRWLQHRTLQQVTNGNEVMVGVTLQTLPQYDNIDLKISDLGIVSANDVGDLIDMQPFIIGYFNGPELMAKIQKLRFKREVVKRKRKADYYMPPPPPIQEIYKLPKTCERLNFTLDFKDLHMHNWVIAPKKFEAYFCGGECNFPLSSKMNASNHAIVQTLIHLKQPHIPKPCCVPTVLGSISILHYLNEDSVNLSKYPQSVAKECGCH